MDKVFTVYRCPCGWYKIKEQDFISAIMDYAVRNQKYFNDIEDAKRECIKENEHLIKGAIEYNNELKPNNNSI